MFYMLQACSNVRNFYEDFGQEIIAIVIIITFSKVIVHQSLLLYDFMCFSFLHL